MHLFGWVLLGGCLIAAVFFVVGGTASLRSAAKEARYLASDFERAAEQLAPGQQKSAKAEENGPSFAEFLQGFKTYFIQEFERGRDVDQIFAGLEKVEAK